MTAEKTEKAEKKPHAAKKPAAHKAAKPEGAAPKKRTGAPKVKKEKVVVAEAVAPEIEVNAAAIEKPISFKTMGSETYYAVGKRKTAVAQIIMSAGNGTITANELAIEKYFETPDLRGIVAQPLVAIGMDKTVNIRGKTHGGGIHAQAEAMRHAIARAVINFDPETRRTLKKLGFLTRDPRVKERKKPGLKRARRAPQFSKR